MATLQGGRASGWRRFRRRTGGAAQLSHQRSRTTPHPCDMRGITTPARSGGRRLRRHSRPIRGQPSRESRARAEGDDGPNSQTDLGVVIQRELPRMRPHPDRVHLFLALVPDVRLDQPGREHVALEQERAVRLERVERSLERRRHGGDLGQRLRAAARRCRRRAARPGRARA